MENATPQAILDFWFKEVGPKRWFAKDAAFDGEIRTRFESTLTAQAGEISHAGRSSWEDAPERALALVILLDQLPRNMYRGNAKSFAFDALALAAARRAVDAGFDLESPIGGRAFFYLPFMHSESLADQDRCVELSSTRLEGEATAKFAMVHRDIIKRFGRFPHRNVLLGRDSSSEEKEFVKTNKGF